MTNSAVNDIAGWGWPSGIVVEAVSRVVEAPTAAIDLESLVAMRLPLAQLVIPRLTAERVRAWLVAHQTQAGIELEQGGLRGALVARDGIGIAFINGSDARIERRFSLAHEVGHFVAEYLAERVNMQRIGGDSMFDVLEGRRAATAAERLRFAVAARPLSVRLWSCTGSPADSERLANRVATELLAPAEILLRVAPPPASQYWTALDLASELAGKAFDIPKRHVEPQIDALWRSAGSAPSFGEPRVMSALRRTSGSRSEDV